MKGSNISLVYGVFVGIALIIYFLLLSLFGLHVHPAFSIFNGVIVGIGIYLSMLRFREHKHSKFKFQKGLVCGMTTGFVATVIFTVFFAIYATEISPGFLNKLIPMWESEWFIGIGSVSILVALGGIASTAVLTLAYSLLLKDSWNTVEASKHTY